MGRIFSRSIASSVATCCVVMLGALPIIPAAAQETVNCNPEAEEVFVLSSGPRITRSDILSENPVTIISGDELRSTGGNSLDHHVGHPSGVSTAENTDPSEYTDIPGARRSNPVVADTPPEVNSDLTAETEQHPTTEIPAEDPNCLTDPS